MSEVKGKTCLVLIGWGWEGGERRNVLEQSAPRGGLVGEAASICRDVNEGYQLSLKQRRAVCWQPGSPHQPKCVCDLDGRLGISQWRSFA